MSLNTLYFIAMQETLKKLLRLCPLTMIQYRSKHLGIYYFNFNTSNKHIVYLVALLYSYVSMRCIIVLS